MNILNFPDEILVEVVYWIDFDDWHTLLTVCKKTNEICKDQKVYLSTMKPLINSYIYDDVPKAFEWAKLQDIIIVEPTNNVFIFGYAKKIPFMTIVDLYADRRGDYWKQIFFNEDESIWIHQPCGWGDEDDMSYIEDVNYEGVWEVWEENIYGIDFKMWVNITNYDIPILPVFEDVRCVKSGSDLRQLCDDAKSEIIVQNK